HGRRPGAGRAGQSRDPRPGTVAQACPAHPVPGDAAVARGCRPVLGGAMGSAARCRARAAGADPSGGEPQGRFRRRPCWCVAGTIESRCNGVAIGLTTRTLAGRGWTIGALTRPGGLGAFTEEPAAVFTDRVVPMGEALAVDDERLVDETIGTDERTGVAMLARALERALISERVAGARRVTELARLVETDRSVQRLDDLCA